MSQLIGIHIISTGGNGINVTTSGGAVLVADDRVTPLTGSLIGGVTHFLSDGTDVTRSASMGRRQAGRTARGQGYRYSKPPELA